MNNPYIQKEIAKIVTANNYPENMALASAWIIANFKGINIKVYDAKETSSLCDYNIIASAENEIQAKAMVDEIVVSLKEHNLELLSLEGMGNAEWILLDLGDIIIHIFQELTRDVFDLDSLWHDQSQLPIPQEYYFSQAEEIKKSEPSTRDYF
ncbi:MAG: ribosome silencing factor [Halobacteriovoraceae bacterium]|jgi:ribosome-associated protein|nr:ribosome silencing factor [Halobacteriovoraceae bacterium]